MKNALKKMHSYYVHTHTQKKKRKRKKRLPCPKDTNEFSCLEICKNAFQNSN